MYDILIIGAGPAGISAGIYAVSRGKKTLVLEQAQVGGIIGKVSTVTHYTALETHETGATFAARMKEQALGAGVEIAYETVTGVELTGEVKTVHTDKGTISSSDHCATEVPPASWEFPARQSWPARASD